MSLRHHVVATFLSGARHNGMERRAAARSNEGSAAADGGMWPALGSLPPRERAAVVLSVCRGLSDEEVARALGSSVPTARTARDHGLESLESMTTDEA